MINPSDLLKINDSFSFLMIGEGDDNEILPIDLWLTTSKEVDIYREPLIEFDLNLEKIFDNVCYIENQLENNLELQNEYSCQ
jgi:hypothetical protein